MLDKHTCATFLPIVPRSEVPLVFGSMIGNAKDDLVLDRPEAGVFLGIDIG